MIYRLWPTWESSQLRELLAVQVEALARDADSLLGAYVDPSTWDPKILQQTRAAARLARSNVEGSVERVLREPIVRNRFDGDLALSLLAAFRRFALGALALHAGLNAGPGTPRAGLAQLRAEIIDSLRILAKALRHGVGATASSAKWNAGATRAGDTCAQPWRVWDVRPAGPRPY